LEIAGNEVPEVVRAHPGCDGSTTLDKMVRESFLE